MKTRLALTAIALISILAVSFVGAEAQDANARIISRMPHGPNEPIAITDIKINGQSVSFDKAFIADDDWMLTLTFTIQNKSDKPIVFANLDLFFKHPQGSNKPTALFDLLSYGNYALTLHAPKNREPLKGLVPGETVDIGFSPQRFVDVTRFLSDTGFPRSIQKVEFRVGRIIFDDDTMWYAGAQLRRDPNEPGRWNVVQQP